MSTSDVTHQPLLPAEPAALMTPRDLSALVSLSPAKLQQMRRSGTGPAFVRVGAAVRYPVAAVRDWIVSLSTDR